MWALNILTSLLLMGCSICWHRTAATGTETLNIPIAENITWSSLNLKTLLEWQPKPENYRYTVEVAAEGENWKKKCINTLATECDVTDLLENVKGTYHARVISQPLDTEEYTEEYPYSTSNSFSPYQQSIIGKPGFESYDFNADSTKLKVIIKDPLTPYRFPNGSFKSIRDVFKDDLRYTLNYRKSSSTGKKQATSSSNEIEISVDKGESYCFFAQATILSRSQNRDSQVSEEKCTATNGNAATYLGPHHEYVYLFNWILLYWLL